MQITDLVYLDATGYHYADFPTFLSYYQSKYRTIYGADVYLEADSQDGQWVAIEAQAAYDLAAVGAAVYNSFSPSTAVGVGLARNVKINNIKKRPATKSTVDVTLIGTSGTVIGDGINGGIVQDTLNQKWDLPAIVTIPPAGEITVTATAQVAGAVMALPNTVNKIFTPTQGWQTVDNDTDATPGAPVETDAELRLRQSVSTANPSRTVFEGTIGAVANVEGVTKYRGYENDTNATDSDGIPAHSISMVVAGGDVTEIAQAILIHKGPGCGTYGTTQETVYDSEGMPSLIKFYRPTIVTIGVEVTITDFAGYSSAYGEAIKAAVAAAITAIGIGNDVLITKLYVPANLPGQPGSETFDITLLRIKKNAGAFGTSNIDILFNELPACDVTNVTVIVT